VSLHASGQQTVGPYLHIGLEWLTTRDIAGRGIKGERFTVAGQLIDGNGVGVGDGLIEIWQANAVGKYAHPEDPQSKPLERGWRGFGRVPTDAKGAFRFSTIKPGRVPGPDGKLQAPHLVVAVFMRGLLKHLATRIYFPDEPANNEDPILKLVPVARRATLVARRSGKNALEWNVILQGKNETVFFDF
jgi:protocatechuate 3,4-dioxygenase, alpha subunit